MRFTYIRILQGLRLLVVVLATMATHRIVSKTAVVVVIIAVADTTTSVIVAAVVHRTEFVFILVIVYSTCSTAARCRGARSVRPACHTRKLIAKPRYVFLHDGLHL